jgi:predicted nucleotidyltransferase
MATTTQKAEWIERMTERIVKNFDPQKVILFGSQVRGDASEESDIDRWLVVMPLVTDRQQLALNIRRALSDCRLVRTLL